MKPTIWNCLVPMLPLAVTWCVLWLLPGQAGHWLVLLALTLSVFSHTVALMFTDSDVELTEGMTEIHIQNTKQRLDGHREELTAIQSLMDPGLKREWMSRATSGRAADGTAAVSARSEGGDHADS